MHESSLTGDDYLWLNNVQTQVSISGSPRVAGIGAGSQPGWALLTRANAQTAVREECGRKVARNNTAAAATGTRAEQNNAFVRH